MGRYTPQTPCAPRAAKHPLRVCSAPRSLKYPRRKEVPPIDFCHIPVSIIKRSEGRSAVAAAAYRSGTKLTNEWDGLTHDYTRKGGVVHAEIMLPAHAPPEFADRSTLWNSVEQIEKARDSQLAREIEAALPRELSREQQLALVRAYVKDNFVDKGMCADFAIHDKGTGNPHVHIMLTVRPLKENGAWGAKCRKAYDLDENGQRIPDGKGGWKNHREDTTDWNDKGNFINAPALVAAVVYQGGMTGGLQCPVGAGRPCRPPNLHIPFVVPVGGVLPVVLPAAFPIRDTLSVLVQIVCLAALCAPLSIFFQRPERQHDMDMRVAGSLVMDSKVGTHSFVYKVVLHIGTHKGELLFAGQFTGQGCFNLAGKLAVPCFLDLLHAVPEDRSVCKFRRRVGRQHDLRMDNAAFPGVVVGHSVPFICQLGSAAVSSCGNGRTACAALDNTDGDMTEIYGEHLLSVRG